MRKRNTQILTAVAVVFGLAAGWFTSDPRWNRLHAQSARSVGGESARNSLMIAGMIELLPNPQLNTTLYRDAVYYLDYKAGRLVVTMPPSLQSANSSRMLGKIFPGKKKHGSIPSMLETMAERDLVADFQLQPSSPARFSMAVGQFGEMSSYLYILEASTRKVALYKASAKKNTSGAGGLQPLFEMVETKSLGNPNGPPMGEVSMTTGSIAFSINPVLKTGVSQDALYVLDEDRGTLWATVPAMLRIGGASKKAVEDFAERDLRADFRIPSNAPARFVMTVGRIGMMTAPLYVFETYSRQTGVYGTVPKSEGTNTRTSIELMELQSIGPRS